MSVFYSPSTRGFYIEGDSMNIPDDAVTITEVERQALLAAQEQGKEIQPDANGYPVAVVPT